jgi:hypothetical protein
MTGVGVMMHGADETSGSLFSQVYLGACIPVRHSLRIVQQVVNDALASIVAEWRRLSTNESATTHVQNLLRSMGTDAQFRHHVCRNPGWPVQQP